jgi:hypothetical protein
MEIGRREYDLFQRGVSALERAAVANEKIVELASEEVAVELEAAPPHCPHCGAINPETMIVNDVSGIKSKMSEIVLPLECLACSKTFYAAAESWLSFRDTTEAKDYFEKGGNGNE